MATRPTGGLSKEELIRLMVGRQIEDYFPPLSGDRGEVVLEVRDLARTGRLSEINFRLHAGEILGIAGMVGSGRNLLARCLLGLEPHDRGEVLLRGRRHSPRSFREAMKAGFGYITDDRKALGILGPRSLKENVTIASLQSYLAWGFLRRRRENADARAQVQRLSIRSSGIAQSVETLSGGNQQKVLIARWLLREPEIFIFSEPTRGIDVGAKAEIYRIMRELTRAGKAILMISSELPEVIGMSDRVLVMQNGQIRGTIDQHEGRTTEEAVMSLAVGHTYSLHQGGTAQ
jgi:ABC-type sugar transport system ATPase subunit